MILILVFGALLASAGEPASVTDQLVRKGKLGIGAAECRDIEAKVGQLLYITVDGFGTNQTINPAYDALVERIQPGGVLPHFQTHELAGLRNATAQLQKVSKLPLMIGVDYEKVFVGKPDHVAQLGMGYYQGLLGSLGNASPECYAKVGFLEGLLHRAIGLNHALGPTVEFHADAPFTPAEKAKRIDALMNGLARSSVETTLKHFPYTPADYSLEKQSRDSTIPAGDVDARYLPIYKDFAKRSGFAMSTHLLNPNVDPNNMATFSRKWVGKLRSEAGFDGILMTDALFMISRYKDAMASLTHNWDAGSYQNEGTVFAVKSILAGHDMVFLESSAKETSEVYTDLVSLSCQNSATGQRLRRRVLQSYDKIKAYKDQNRGPLRADFNLPVSLVKKVIEARRSTDVCSADISAIEREFSALGHAETLCRSFRPTPTNLNADLASLRTLVAHMSPRELNEAILSNDGELNDEVMAFIAKNPPIKAALVTDAERLFTSRNPKDQLNALHTMKALDAWPASVIATALNSKDPAVLPRVLGDARYAKLPPVEAPIEQILAAAERLRAEDRYEGARDKLAHLVRGNLSPDDRASAMRAALDSGVLDQRSQSLLSAYFTANKINALGVSKFLSLPLSFPDKTKLLIESGVIGTGRPLNAEDTRQLLRAAGAERARLDFSNANDPNVDASYSPLDVLRTNLSAGFFTQAWTPAQQKTIIETLDQVANSPAPQVQLFARYARLDVAPSPRAFADYLAVIENQLPKLDEDTQTQVRSNILTAIQTRFIGYEGQNRIVRLPPEQVRHSIDLVQRMHVSDDDTNPENVKNIKTLIDDYRTLRSANAGE